MVEDTVKKEECTGCKLCEDICPTNAIDFFIGEDGFWYPKVNKEKCISCDKCDKLCPLHNNKDNREEICVYGAWSKNENIRASSTSGGIFSELAIVWLKNGGICYGASYDNELNVRHIKVTNSKELEFLRTSKYVQSDLAGIYKQIAKELVCGKNILFSGTPCQVVALKSYLSEFKYSAKLLTVDFICHGVPSPLAYRKYIEQLECKYKSKATRIIFKHKKRGWHNLGTKILFSNGKKYFQVAKTDMFMKSYIISDVNIRTSCYQCSFRGLPHYSDITLGDFWGIEFFHPEYDDNKGTSLVLINSDKGNQIWNSIQNQIKFFTSTVDEISKFNKAVNTNRSVSANRNVFFSDINSHKFSKAALISCNENEFILFMQKSKDKIKSIMECTGLLKYLKKGKRK